MASHVPLGSSRFLGAVPDGYALIGVLSKSRTVETLFVVPDVVELKRSAHILYAGQVLEHVSDGPDGRWQYEDRR